MVKTNLSLDADRMWADVMALAEIADRRGLDAAFVYGVISGGPGLAAQRFGDAGLSTQIDASAI